MRCMVMVKATDESEAGTMPAEELLAAMLTRRRESALMPERARSGDEG